MSAILEDVNSAIIKRKKLLLVDPEPEVDNLLIQVVTSDGWHIERAPDNETALLLVRAGPFDLVITGQTGIPTTYLRLRRSGPTEPRPPA